MAVEEQSSQDSTLIDDDLVAALGFEPVTTIDVPTEDVSSNGDEAADNAELDGVAVEEDVVADDDLSPDDELQGFSIGEIDESEADLISDEAAVVEDRASFFDLESPDVDSPDLDSVDLDGADLDSVDLESVDLDSVDLDSVDLDSVDLDSGEEVVEDLTDLVEADATDDLEIADDLPDGEALSLDDSALDAPALDDPALDDSALDGVVTSDLDAVPSITDVDVDPDATAQVSLIDLDSDHVDVPEIGTDDVAVADVDVADVHAEDASVGAHDALPFDSNDVIDLEVVDLSDAPVAGAMSTQGFVDAEVHELADADSVFADATPVLDPGVFDDAIGHPATETVDQVGSGLLDLDPAEETVGAAAVATAATGTATKGRRRLRARKSRRVIRHIDPWSVLTFSVLFHMVVFAALLLASVLVWNAAIASGMVENVESFIQELGDYETFEINADVMFRAAIVIAGMLTLASSVLVVLLTVVFNLISDLVGGIRVTVIEEETVRVPIDKKRSKARNE